MGGCWQLVDRKGALKTYDLSEPTPLSTSKLVAPSSEVTGGLLISPDNKWLVGLTQEGTSRLWDLTAEAPTEPRLLHHDRLAGLCAFSPDSTRFAMILDSPSVQAASNAVTLWKLDRRSSTLDTHLYSCQVNSPFALAFSPDGEWLAVAGDSTAVWLLETSQGQTFQLLGHDRNILRAAFAADGRLYTSCLGQASRRWLLNAGQPETEDTWRAEVPVFNYAVTDSAATRIAVSGALGAQVRRLDSSSDDFRWLADRRGEPQYRTSVASRKLDALRHQKGERMAFHPDGDLLAALSDRIELWDLRSETAGPKMLVDLKDMDRSGTFCELVFSPDGRFLIYNLLPEYLTPQINRHVGLVDLAADPPRATLLFGEQVTPNSSVRKEVAVTPDSHRLIAIGEQGKVNVFELQASDIRASRKELSLATEQLTALAVFPDSRSIAVGLRGEVILCDLNPAEATKRGTLAHPGMMRVIGLAISRNGRWLVANSQDGEINRNWKETGQWLGLFDLVRDGVRVLSGHEGQVIAVTISADSRWIATGGDDGTIRVWDTESQEPSRTQRVIRAHRLGVLSVAFTPDARELISTGRDNCVRKWDLDVPLLAEKIQQSAGRFLTVEEVQAFEVPEVARPELQAAVFEAIEAERNGRFALRGDPITAWVPSPGLRALRDDARGKLAKIVAVSGWERFEDAVGARNKLEMFVQHANRILKGIDTNIDELLLESAGARQSPSWLELVRYRVADERRRGQVDEAMRTVDALAVKADPLALPGALTLYAFLGNSLDEGDLPMESVGRARDECRRGYLRAFRSAIASGWSPGSRLPDRPEFLGDSAEIDAILMECAGSGRLLDLNLARASTRMFPKVTASHTSPVDEVGKACDGVVEFRYTPHNRWTAYGSKTPADWLQIEFEHETEFSRVELASTTSPRIPAFMTRKEVVFARQQSM